MVYRISTSPGFSVACSLNRKYTTSVVIQGIRRNVVKRAKSNVFVDDSNGIPPIRSSGEDVGGISKGLQSKTRVCGQC